MIDLATETLLTLEEAGEKLSVHKTTLYRWITHGTNGIKLEAARVGSRWRTSEEALQRFSDRLTPQQEPSPSPISIRTAKQRQRDQERVERELDEMFGIRHCASCDAKIVAPSGAIPKGERAWCPKCLITRKSAKLGQRIRTFRWASLLSQKELSNRSGISVDNIRAYEHNEKKPSQDHLDRLTEELGEDLISGLPGNSPGHQNDTES